MSKKILLALLISVLFILSCSSTELTYTPPPIENTWSVTMTQSGGIAGIMRTVAVSSDGSYTVTDERSNHSSTNQLTEEEVNTLKSLVETFQFTSSQSRSGCADCFEYELEIESNGKKMIVNADDISLPDSGAGELVMFLQNLFE